MTEKTETNNTNPEQPGADDDRADSKGIFFTIIGLILIGTAGWYAMTLLGAEPIGVERAKELAEDFERECYLETQDQDKCRELIGAHHRDCLFENIERVDEGTGDDGGDVQHDREGYMNCMREETGIGTPTSADDSADETASP